MFRTIESLVGKTLLSARGKEGDNEMVFVTTDGVEVVFYHEQDCCENVSIEDVCGDLNDLVGSPLLIAEEVTNRAEDNEDLAGHENYDSFTWTFYKFSTINGSVTVRWLGTSNGYYSEDVSIQVTRL